MRESRSHVYLTRRIQIRFQIFYCALPDPIAVRWKYETYDVARVQDENGKYVYLCIEMNFVSVVSFSIDNIEMSDIFGSVVIVERT